MTSDPLGAPRRRRGSRMWWAAPLAVAAATGFVSAVVVLPGVAGRSTVPTQLVVRDQARQSTSPDANASKHPAKHRKRHRSSPPPAVTQPTAVAPAATRPPTTHVVEAEHPVVQESDERTEDRRTSGYDDDSGSEDTNSATPTPTVSPTPNQEDSGGGDG